MPKITAVSVEEHVAMQQQRVFDGAIELFTECGYSNVSMGDIAERVGLARNSLYRYFPNKAAILIRWFRFELEARIRASSALLDQDHDPMSLVGEWVDDQLDYASKPQHTLLSSMAQLEPQLAAEAREELFGNHSRLLDPLGRVLERAGVDPELAAPTSELINGLVLSAARYESVHGSPDATVRDRARCAIRALMS